MTETRRISRFFVQSAMLIVGMAMVLAAAPALVANAISPRALVPVLLLLGCLVVLSTIYDRLELR